MRKKCFLPVLAALLMLFLTSCGCKHDWIEADCEIPQTCTLCGETQADALGHHWLDATCMAPRTCTRCAITQGAALDHCWQEASCDSPQTCAACGETQGEALGHVLSKWSRDGEDMIRFCEICDDTQRAALDRDLMVQERVVGTWKGRIKEARGPGRVTIPTPETTYVILENRTTFATDCALTFHADGTLSYCTDREYSGTWTVSNVTNNQITIKLVCPQKANLTQFTARQVGEDMLYVEENTANSMATYRFCRADQDDPEGAIKRLTEDWRSLMRTDYSRSSDGWGESVIHLDSSVAFRKDGTVQMQLNEELSGEWIYTGKEFPGDGDVCYEFCVIAHNGTVACHVRMYEDSLYVSKDDYVTSSAYTFAQLTDAQMSEFQKGSELLPGTWETVLVEKYDETADWFLPVENGDYTMDFKASGQFSAALAQTESGIWRLEGYDPEQGCMFSFIPYGGMQAHVFYLRDEKLQGTVHTGEETLRYTLEKAV